MATSLMASVASWDVPMWVAAPPATRNPATVQTANRVSLSSISATTVFEFVTATPARNRGERDGHLGDDRHRDAHRAHRRVVAAAAAEAAEGKLDRARLGRHRDRELRRVGGERDAEHRAHGGHQGQELRVGVPLEDAAQAARDLLRPVAYRQHLAVLADVADAGGEVAQPLVLAAQGQRAVAAGVGDGERADLFPLLSGRAEAEMSRSPRCRARCPRS